MQDFIIEYWGVFVAILPLVMGVLASLSALKKKVNHLVAKTSTDYNTLKNSENDLKDMVLNEFKSLNKYIELDCETKEQMKVLSDEQRKQFKDIKEEFANLLTKGK